jgi:hypothetical protein
MDRYPVIERFRAKPGLFGVLRHSVHLGLQLLRSDRTLPVILHGFRIAQIVFDFLFQLRLRYYRIQRRLGIGTILWPNAVTPVNVFYCSLMSYAFCERQRWFPLDYTLLGSVSLRQRERDCADGR